MIETDLYRVKTDTSKNMADGAERMTDGTERLSPRDRILATASELFYRYGFQAVGVDRIVEESGVAKMTLYRHFESKDDLIVAYLERSNRQFWTWFEASVEGINDPKERLLAVFRSLETLATSRSCLGCTFQSTAAEFPDASHAAHRLAHDHKLAVRRRLEAMTLAAGLRNAEVAADHLMLLMDGAWVAARMFKRDSPAGQVAGAARILIESQLYAQSVAG